MRFFSSSLIALLGITSAFASPSRTRPRWDTSTFVTASGTELFVNGSKFAFVATNAYWLPYLNSDEDISNVLAEMKSNGITVVRTWAFNDVTEIPSSGSFLQLIANGTTTINTGANGLQRLDKVLELAAQHGIYILFSLTNNWNPIPEPSSGSGSPPPLPRNFLSNDYGGMDAYVRAFTKTQTHDQFYTDATIRNFYEKYLQAVVSRYIDNTALLGWELANDPRCSSSLPASPSCNTITITEWHSAIAAFIHDIDPNHLITSGNQGFLCPSCPKLFFHPPPPTPSPAPGDGHKRSTRGFTVDKLLRMISNERRAEPRASTPRDGKKIRGGWTASNEAKRGSAAPGPAFDGSSGVDSQDILSIPQISLGSFQLFPDQNSYAATAGPFVPPSADFNATVSQTLSYIQVQGETAKSLGKPLVLTAFGIVTQDNLEFFVPFNATTPVVTSSSPKKRQSSGSAGVTNAQQQSLYTQTLQASVNAGASGMSQYQYSSQNLQPVSNGRRQVSSLGTTPNDGYGLEGAGGAAVLQILLQASQNLT